jgi:hypothetical protein
MPGGIDSRSLRWAGEVLLDGRGDVPDIHAKDLANPEADQFQ